MRYRPGILIGSMGLGVWVWQSHRTYLYPPQASFTLPLVVLGGFFVLTVGGVGVRGATSLLGGDIVTGLQNLADFALQVPTVALALASGVILTDHWPRHAPEGVTAGN